MTTNKIYQVIWQPKATKQLEKIGNKKIETEIKEKVKNDLVKDPYRLGEKLKDKYWDGSYKYRVRDYRIFYNIIDDKVLIEILKVEDIRSSYKKK